MPSAFDELVRELRAIDEIDALDQHQQADFLKAMRGEMIGARPADRVTVENALDAARRGSPASDLGRDVVFSPADRRKPEAVAQPASVQGPHAARAHLTQQAKPAMSLAEISAEIQRMTEQTRAVCADANAAARADAKRRMREHVRETLGRAVKLVAAGSMTAHEASTIEARAHRIMQECAQ